MKPYEPTPLPKGLDKDWRLIEALRGGTPGMRDAGKAYLPQRPMEEDGDYAVRLQLATLFPAFTETVRVMCGRVFAQPLQYTEDVPPWIRDEVLDDVDMQGRNLHVFARETFSEALSFGLSHILVDSPEAGQARTLEDARRARLRPYLIHVSPRQVLGWRENGDQLTQLRIKFDRVEDDGEYGQQLVEEVRVYTLQEGKVLVQVWERRGKAWDRMPDRNMDVPRIPLVTFYTGRVGFMQAEPPLRELAYLNAKHWHMQSGHDMLVDTATVPILFGRGFEGREVVIGGKHMITVDSPNAELKYVEHTGAAIKSGQEALQGIEDQMRQSGGKLLVPQGITKTATQANEEAARENSALGSMVQDLEDTLDDLMDVIALWRGETDGGSVKVRANLDPDFAPADSMRVLLEMRRDGNLSRRTVFEEGKRRGMISDEVDWGDEEVRIDEEGPI